MFNKDVLAIVLGGGRGSRLYPLTANRSKPAVSIAGKFRLVDIPISNCINSEIKRMFVLTQFNSASLNRHIKNTYHFSFFSAAFVDVLAAEQTNASSNWFQGTADAVRQSMHHFLKHDFKYALILSGDQLYQMDFNEMLERHIKSEADITLATIPVNEKDAPSFGILKSNEFNEITSFIEKPSSDLLSEWTSNVSAEKQREGKHYLASMGIYIFNKDLLIELMNDTTTVDFGKEVIPQSIGKLKTVSYQYEGYWTDIGTIESFFEANLELTNDIPAFDMYNLKKRIYTRSRMLPTSKISGTTLENVVIASGCIINATKIKRSVIGIRSRIGQGSEITNTYIMGSDYYESLEDLESGKVKTALGVGKDCIIDYAIIDKNCRIGDNVIIKGGKHLEDHETEMYMVVEGIVIIKKEAEIPNNFTIGND